MTQCWVLKFWNGGIQLFSSKKKLNDFMKTHYSCIIHKPKENDYYLTIEQEITGEYFATYYKSKIN